MSSAIVAIVLALINPLFGMLYLGRPVRAIVYLGLATLAPISAFALARGGVWPAGISWTPLLYLVHVVGAVEAFRIAGQTGTTRPDAWYTTWSGLALVVVVLAAITGGARAYFFEAFDTPSESMLPTLVVGDEFFVNKFAYRKTPPQRSDLIVFRAANDDTTYVKRIIGLPGDTVVYTPSNEGLTINGRQAELEPLGPYSADAGLRLAREKLGSRSHLIAMIPSVPSRGGTYRVPQGQYFVLGDNRDNSRDSRFEDFGLVPAANIVGRVGLVWWNTSHPERAGTLPE